MTPRKIHCLAVAAGEPGIFGKFWGTIPAPSLTANDPINGHLL